MPYVVAKVFVGTKTTLICDASFFIQGIAARRVAIVQTVDGRGLEALLGHLENQIKDTLSETRQSAGHILSASSSHRRTRRVSGECVQAKPDVHIGQRLRNASGPLLPWRQSR